MSAEDRWADRVEWAEERRFDCEIQSIRSLKTFTLGAKCESPDCENQPVICYTIGRTGDNGGDEILLCLDHNSQERAWEVYDSFWRSRP